MERNQDIRYNVVAAPRHEEKGADKEKGVSGVDLLRWCAEDPNDSAAWHEFLRRYQSAIRLFVLRASRSKVASNYSGLSQEPASRREDEDDLVQNVFLKLISNDCVLLKRFKGETEDSVYRYLSVISSSVVTDYYKYLRRARRAHRRAYFRNTNEIVSPRLNIHEENQKTERMILVNDLINIVEDLLRQKITRPEIRTRYLSVFKLHILNGLSLTEIRQHSGIKTSRVGIYKMAQRIVRDLRQRLSLA